MADDAIAIIAEIRATPGREADLVTALRELVEHTWREDGPLAYAGLQVTDDPARIIVFETWPDQATLQRHLEQTMTRFVSDHADLIVDVTSPADIQATLGTPLLRQNTTREAQS